MTRPTDFTLSDIQADDPVWSCTAHVPEDLLYFDGHFDELPVLAGVAQLEALVAVGAARAWPERGHIVRCSRIKFRQMIKPGDTLVLRLERRDPAIKFTIHRGDELCTQGNIELA